MAKRTPDQPPGAGAGAAKSPKVPKRRWYHQLRDVYVMTRKQDPKITWLLIGAFAAGLGVFALIGVVAGTLWYWLLIGVPVGILLAMVVLGRRAEKAAYAQVEGQPGAAAAALGTLRKWIVEKEPAAVDPKTQDLVFRAIGRPGVVLVSEGPAHRVSRLLEAERKRVARILPNVPVHLIQEGRGEGQVPLPELTRALKKLKKQLTATETTEISKRLRALGSARLPVPKGIDPMRVRPDRRGMRGR